MQHNKLFRIVVISLVGLTSCVSTKMNQHKFFFVQMSDPQFGFFNDNKSFEKETINYTKAINEVNKLNPAFLVVTGDLVNKPFDIAQVNEYLKISKQLNANIPLYSVAGNHDVGNNPIPADIERYQLEVGKDYYSFTSHTMLGIVLNSLYLSSPNKVIDKALEQENWLLKILEDSKSKRYKHIIVFLHHPLFLNMPNEENGYFNIPINTRKKYLDIFEKYGIKHVFAGHYHRNAYGKFNEINMITTGPVGKPLGQDSSGFRIIYIKGNKLKHQYYHLDSIPNRIKF